MKVNPIYRALLDKSISCMLSAIELYNKPDFKYREDAFAILSVNAWELLLKSQLFKCNKYTFKAICKTEPLKTKAGTNHKRKTIISLNRCGNKKTLDIESVVKKLSEAKPLPKEVINNIEALIELRDNAIHFINPESISKQIQELGFACIKNYMTFIDDWNIEIDLSKYNLYLMPLAYINEKTIVDASLNCEAEHFLSFIKKLRTDETGSSYDVLLSIDVQFKKGNSLDAIPVKTTKDSDLTITLSEEDFQKQYPWSYKKVAEESRKRYSNFKQAREFNDAMAEIKNNPKLAKERKLYPDKPNSAKTYYYSTNVWIILDKYFTRKNGKAI